MKGILKVMNIGAACIGWALVVCTAIVAVDMREKTGQFLKDSFKFGERYIEEQRES